MMGERQSDQPELFYGFSLERHVAADHLLRSIDRFVDLGGMREQLRPYYSETGRPSIDPELMIRMLIIGYCLGIRSERRLCDEVHLNLAYRWFCRLGLDGAVPDHSTFSKNRHGRFRESDLLRKLFEETVARCIAEGLVGGEGFAVDASMINADANRQHSTPGDEWEPPDDPGHAVREYLAVLDEAAFGDAGRAQVHLRLRSRLALDRRQWRARLLRLLHQLSDRPEVRRDHGRRGDDGRAPSRGYCPARDARSHPGALRHLARAAGGRHRLRLGREPRLAGPREGYRAAHPGV
jgi:transposase